MQEPDDQRLVDDDTPDIDLNDMEQASSSTAVTDSAVNLTEDEDER